MIGASTPLMMTTEKKIDPRDALTIDLPTYGPVNPSEWLKIDWSQYLQSAMIGGRSFQIHYACARGAHGVFRSC